MKPRITVRSDTYYNFISISLMGEKEIYSDLKDYKLEQVAEYLKDKTILDAVRIHKTVKPEYEWLLGKNETIEYMFDFVGSVEKITVRISDNGYKIEQIKAG